MNTGSERNGTYLKTAKERQSPQNVAKELVTAGIERSRLTALGVGPAAPVSSNEMEAGRAKNRRVE
ncbi:MAG: OmpA family protein, partial [Candidatus Thiodiazotropha sp.]